MPDLGREPLPERDDEDIPDASDAIADEHLNNIRRGASDTPADIEDARERIRKLITPYRDSEELTDYEQGKLQGYHNALAVLGGENRDGDDGFETPPMADFIEENQTADELNEMPGLGQVPLPDCDGEGEDR